jgi:tRNA-dihydrouridine synthase 3
MALSAALLSGSKPEWALTRAHPTESQTHHGPANSYFGIQIAGGKLPPVVQSTELLTKLCGNGIDTIDLNCGCPLDMVFRAGAGSALLDSQGKLMKMVKGMVTVSGEIPITCKIRMGVNNSKNTAGKLVQKIILENVGVSAVTLHGRSRAQRYSKAADWKYIAECAAIIKVAKQEMAATTDSSKANLEFGDMQRMAFIGYHKHYLFFLMLGMGMLILMWTFTMQ